MTGPVEERNPASAAPVQPTPTAFDAVPIHPANFTLRALLRLFASMLNPLS